MGCKQARLRSGHAVERLPAPLASPYPIANCYTSALLLEWTGRDSPATGIACWAGVMMTASMKHTTRAVIEREPRARALHSSTPKVVVAAALYSLTKRGRQVLVLPPRLILSLYLNAGHRPVSSWGALAPMEALRSA